MFDRIISVDWSGAGSETKGVDLRIAVFDAAKNQSQIVDPPYRKRTVVSWSRQAFRAWIVEQLRGKQPALVAIDFGFGLPWASDQAVFKIAGWREMIRKIAEKYQENGTARATAQAINNEERFGGHGPYRFNPNRNDFRFYLEWGRVLPLDRTDCTTGNQPVVSGFGRDCGVPHDQWSGCYQLSGPGEGSREAGFRCLAARVPYSGRNEARPCRELSGGLRTSRRLWPVPSERPKSTRCMESSPDDPQETK